MNNSNKKDDTFPAKLFKILSDTDSRTADDHPNSESIILATGRKIVQDSFRT